MMRSHTRVTAPMSQRGILIQSLRAATAGLHPGIIDFATNGTGQLPMVVADAHRQALLTHPLLTPATTTSQDRSHPNLINTPVATSTADHTTLIEQARAAVAELLFADRDCVLLYATKQLASVAIAAGCQSRLARGGLLLGADVDPIVEHTMRAAATATGAAISIHHTGSTTNPAGHLPSGDNPQPDPQLRLAVLALSHLHTGVVSPLPVIAETLRSQHRLWIVCDVSTLVGRLPLNVDELGCDILLADLASCGAPGITAVVCRDQFVADQLTGANTSFRLASSTTTPGATPPQPAQPYRKQSAQPASWPQITPNEVCRSAAAGVCVLVDFLASLARLPQADRPEQLYSYLTAVQEHIEGLLAELSDAISDIPQVHIFGDLPDTRDGDIALFGTVAIRMASYTAAELAAALADYGIICDQDPFTDSTDDSPTQHEYVAIHLTPTNTSEEIAALIAALTDIARGLDT
ncbi:aminotransferase class V-fold PLP-dependent enzyme [Corynebacterium choanae]|uniref:Aminotransferase class-V n=1 Tax=Corynebacterium choanae TaxID=1862358 RepID=A0A3G6J9N9_9CORY|nr:aminotransferase class V-fold PLP-dependent enzyme [Corynebacterium choanae]AZA14629.1 Aminotransferase class-V [Corynebacterium choanae]